MAHRLVRVTPAKAAPPRSLADDLRGRCDVELAELLRRRPDLLQPVASDITSLAARATTGPSVARCLDQLGAPALYVLGLVARLSADAPVTTAAVTKAAAERISDKKVIAAALAEIRTLGLIWGPADCVRAISAVRDLVGDAEVTWPRPEPVIISKQEPKFVDEQSGLNALETVAHVREVLDAWATEPPQVLRSGGLSIRDFAAITRMLGVDASQSALWIELAHAAGLLADDQEENPCWVPTDAYDRWLVLSSAQQWSALAQAWLTMPRLSSRADDRTNLLTADADRRAVVLVRRSVLELMSEVPVGKSIDIDSLRAVLDDRHPRRQGALRDQALDATIHEGTALGVIAAGSLTTAGRALLGSSDPVAAITSWLPAEIDHVLLQGDMTMIAPGPLTASLSRQLRVLADIESRGHATAYRITPDSIRRALDIGWDSEGIQELLTAASATKLPQALVYLIDDTARRHGAVRVGTAMSYIRCDEPGTLATLLGDRRMKSLVLHRIASTVLVSQAPASEVIATLRDNGFAPAAEAPDGTVVVRRSDERRTATPKASKAVTSRRNPETLITAALKALRASERSQSAPRGAMVAGPASAGAIPRSSSAAIIAALKVAILENSPMWISYADTDGTNTDQIVDPIRLGSGTMTAFDHRTEQVRTFTIARVSGVAPLES